MMSAAHANWGLVAAAGMMMGMATTYSAGASGPGATNNVAITALDDDAIGYATFQSHNQKVVANEYGVFTTHLRTANGNFTAQTWRLSQSTDGGKTFRTVFEGVHDTGAPVLETDKAGNIYLARCDGASGGAYLYFFEAPEFNTAPRITPIPNASSGKYAMALDEDAGRIYFISANEMFHVLALDGTVLRSTRLFQPGPHAYVMYPSLALGPDGTLYAGLTTQENTRYNYWDIHWLVSRDHGQSWQKADGTPLATPFIADDTGPTDRLTLDDEFNVHTWLSAWLFANGRMHAAYWSEILPNRQRYLRLNPTNGNEEVSVTRVFDPATNNAVVNESGVLVRGSGSPRKLYFVSTVDDRARLACMVSSDNGATWTRHATSTNLFDTRVYSIGGFREVANGNIIGTFTVVQPGSSTYYEPHSGKVYFFSIPTGEPAVVNRPAANITATSASLVADLTNTGGAPTEVYCFWGAADAGTNLAGWANTNYLGTNAVGLLTNYVSGLTGSTRYYCAFYASNSAAGILATPSASFSALGAPAVSNRGATSLSTSSAALCGEVTGGNPTPTACIYWDTTTHGTNKSDWPAGKTICVGPATNWTFSATIPVTVGLTYYYRCYASNSFGEAWAPETANFTAPAETVRYVDGLNGSDAHDGLSWGAAYETLAKALAQAGASDRIWVAAGTYSPGSGTAASFDLKSSVALYGGFTNGGSMADRNWTNNPTILDGGGTSWHVVKCMSKTDVVLDGFTIKGGNAAGTDWNTFGMYGGGMLADGSSFVLNNCIITGNVANAGGVGGIGGGLAVVNSAVGVVSNCAFIGNSAFAAGGNWCAGGVAVDFRTGGGGSIAFKSCVFRANSAHDGGAALVWGPGASFASCDFIGNSAIWYAGGVGISADSPAPPLVTTPFVNCTFVSNTAGSYYGGGLATVYQTALLINCSFSANSASRGGAAAAYMSAQGNLVMTNCILWGNSAASSDPEIYLGTGSATVDYSDVQGGWAGTGNLDANPLLADASSDLHLKSKYGRWTPGGWVTDAQSSPCIDAGAPGMAYAQEPAPNGGRINMGACGNTPQASKSCPPSGLLIRVR